MLSPIRMAVKQFPIELSLWVGCRHPVSVVERVLSAISYRLHLGKADALRRS